MNALEAILEAVEARFGRDAAGRLAGGSEPAPLFALVRSEFGVAWRMRAGLEHGRVVAVARLAGREPALRTMMAGEELQAPERLQPISDALAAVGRERLRAWRPFAGPRSGGGGTLELLGWDEQGRGEALHADLWLFR